MSIATLSDIITKARKLTGSGTMSQLTDAMIIDYVNSFYLYDFPAEFRSLELKNFYTFNCTQGIDTYPFDFDHWTTLESPCYVDKRLVNLYQSPWPFYSLFFNWQNRETFATGDGTVGSPYTGTAQSTPLNRSYNNNPVVDSELSNTSSFPTGYPVSFNDPNIARCQNILIEANTATGSLHVTDDGAGNLIGDGTGTIDYVSGAISITFTSAVPSGNDINIHYNATAQAIPQAILFWQNNITLRPIPDRSYTIEIVGYRLPSQAILGSGSDINMSGRPEQLEWWETLAVGTAKKIYQDRGDEIGEAKMDKILAEMYNLNETRTYAQLGKQRAATIYSQQNQGFSGGYWYGNN